MYVINRHLNEQNLHVSIPSNFEANDELSMHIRITDMSNANAISSAPVHTKM